MKRTGGEPAAIYEAGRRRQPSPYKKYRATGTRDAGDGTRTASTRPATRHTARRAERRPLLHSETRASSRTDPDRPATRGSLRKKICCTGHRQTTATVTADRARLLPTADTMTATVTAASAAPKPSKTLLTITAKQYITYLAVILRPISPISLYTYIPITLTYLRNSQHTCILRI